MKKGVPGKNFNLAKNLLFIFVIFLIISGLFALLNPTTEKPEVISLTELSQEIEAENVKKIIIEGNELKIELKDDTQKNALKENEISLRDSLVNISEEKLAKVDVKVEEPSGAKFWLAAILPFLLPFLLIGALLFFMLRSAQRANIKAMSFGKSKPRLNLPSKDGKKKITFEDVAGVKEAKEELKEIIDFLKNPKKFIEIGARIPRGALLLGPPGCGKTLLARAVAGEANVPFFSISGSEFVEMFVGVGASRVRDLFRNAKKNTPCIIFIDELDAVGRHRGAGLGGGHDEREQTLNQILVEMDGFEPNMGIIVMAATNRPDILDPALLRPGRFDRRIILGLPDIKDRIAILKIHIRGKPLTSDVDVPEIAERTPGFSGADLANLVNEAAILAARRDKKQVGRIEFLESIEKVMLGPERKSHLLNKDEKKIAAYHEAAHALVASSLPCCDPVQKVSIVSRGMVAGYTLKVPKKDKHLHSKKGFIDELVVLLAGYACEEIVFKDLTTGATNDLQKASELARKLVTQYGMSKKIGPMTFEGRGELVFLGKEIGEQRNYSEKVAAKIDEEVARFIKDAYETAKKILKAKRKKLNKIAKRLIEKETIERKEFEKLVKSK